MKDTRTLLQLVPMGYQADMPNSTTPPPPAEFSQVWRRLFSETPPLGHVLRYDFSDYWTRFHALPESKRYADANHDWDTVLSRANTLTTECFGDHARVWVVTGYFADLMPKGNGLPVRMSMTKAMNWIDESEDPSDQFEITFFAKVHDWKPRSLDGLFGEIANDRERAVLFSENTQTVLAPYGGGFDIISLLPGKINELESRYRTWMSDRSDRL
ncbi:DUF3885 domain-containing protein [Epibacterium sp. Ofav1-8]|uniref:DUF3885 domain-containing protein n=1 Tax=Epibacterium sp. Ofav1-8 TaxID=2917735 RepID=UPI003F8D5D49